jgi:glyceraldehyde 3-phosphate dehydrogenase
MKRLKVGLNGFGRIGRAFTRIALNKNQFDVVAINTRKTPNDMLSYLLQHDSVYRTYDKKVAHSDNGISIDDKLIKTTQFDKPSDIVWGDADVVVDATGAFKTKEDLSAHIKGSVKNVIITSPTNDATIPHVVLGVNDDSIDFTKETVISNASCTTNCASPMFKVLHDNFSVLTGFLTTTHAYTQSQSLLDDAGKSIERSRAAAINIIPSTTGAAKAVVKTIPALEGKIDGMALRVPVPTVSFSDISVVVNKQTTPEEVNSVFKKASMDAMKNILSYETQVLVSSDYIGSTYSCIFDSNYTKVLNGHLIKVFGWYDNEWGYSNRLVDLVIKLSQSFS